MTSTFPTSADEFYALRDDRTNRMSSSRQYQDVLCEVRVSAIDAANPATQATVLVAANLLSRWCRRVVLNIPPVPIGAGLNAGTGSLAEIVLDQMRDADPFGRFGMVRMGGDEATLILHIGENATPVAGCHNVFVTASGWLATVSKEGPILLPDDDKPNWLGATAAACLGVAHLFKAAIGVHSERYLRDGIFDVFELKWIDNPQQAPWPETLNVGNVLLVGAGSVGSSAVFSMRLNRFAGSLTIVDRDFTKIENFNRSPIFGRKMFGQNKAEALKDYLRGTPLSAMAVPLWWDQFVLERSRSSFDFDVWLPLANEFGVRLAIQNAVPPLMIHASTTSNWGVNHGRHIPGRDDCLSDRFPSEVFSEQLACASGDIDAPGGQVDAALPFTSTFAGMLVAADLVRSLLPAYPQVPNFALFDWFGMMDIIHAWNRVPRPNCFCRHPSKRLHEMFNSKTRAYPLFGLIND